MAQKFKLIHLYMYIHKHYFINRGVVPKRRWDSPIQVGMMTEFFNN